LSRLLLAAQLLASHNAAMECYRRAMVGEQTFEGRRESLSQANKLSRTYAVLLEALHRHRGKGQQKVTVEHVHVHSGGLRGQKHAVFRPLRQLILLGKGGLPWFRTQYQTI
jgi:hypothetical protein